MHHSRRKSGHGSGNTSMTDVRKAGSSHHTHDGQRIKSKSNRSSRVMMSPPSSSSSKLGKSPKDREREWEEERYYDDESATFPQFCMSCEKQFFPQDERILYCSESCRRSDQTATATPYTSSSSYYGAISPAPINNYPFYAAEHPEPRDIVPRASPSRPTSTHFASPPSPPELPHTYHPSSAISALRNLSLNNHPPSPPSSSAAGGIWPFTSSGRSTTTSPSSSYTRSNSGFLSSTYDAAYAYPSYPMGADRPLPSRRPGAGYSRPKSIQLVTPMIGR